jgi:hypothetical protein
MSLTNSLAGGGASSSGGGGGAGDVTGPASSTDNALARYDGTGGKTLQSSIAVLSDAGSLTGLTSQTTTGNVNVVDSGEIRERLRPTAGMDLGSGMGVRWYDDTDVNGAVADLVLTRDAAGVLGIANAIAIETEDPAVTPLSIGGAPSQSANLVTIFNSAGTPVGRIYLHSTSTGGIEMWSGGNVNARLYAFYGMELGVDREVRWSNSSSNLTTIDAAIQRAAASVLRVTDGGSGLGALLSGRASTARTTDLTLSAAEGRRVYHNDGAAGTVVLTLPAALVANGVGPEFLFAVHTTQILRVKAAGTDIIRNGTAVSTAGGQLDSLTVGSTLLLNCSKNGVWTSISTGTWTAS